jgi:zinc transport system ATP-binding protein
MKNVIEIENLNVHYDNLCALSNINLKVKDKEFLAIMGPNGGGKSTLLKSLLGLKTPSYGDIKILGQKPNESSGYIGYVPQFSKFDKNFPIDVMDVILSGRLAKRKGFLHKYNREDKELALSIMKDLKIEHLKDRQISQLSGGQLQRVLIARALAVEPKILLLDEPTASLDGKSKTQIYSILKKLNKRISVIIVTHDIEAICSYVNSIACINKKLYYHGKSELNNTIVEQVYGCPIDLIAHGVPHRVLNEHKEDKNDKCDT